MGMPRNWGIPYGTDPRNLGHNFMAPSCSCFFIWYFFKKRSVFVIKQPTFLLKNRSLCKGTPRFVKTKRVCDKAAYFFVKKNRSYVKADCIFVKKTEVCGKQTACMPAFLLKKQKSVASRLHACLHFC
jgi:hypothetical protein